MKNEIAILLAAGIGSRMLPLTEKIPKPLVTINGVPLIETMIEGLKKRNVKQIYVVVGYLKDKFGYLTEKYENVSLIENREYRIKNNLSSVYAAKDLLGEGDCFICEADIYVRSLEVLQTELYRSCYFGKMVSGSSDDWLFRTNGDRITHIRKGGANAYIMTGIAFFKKDDAVMLAEVIEKVYKRPESANLFWDEAVNEILDKIYVQVHPVLENELIEMDTVNELAKIDPMYER